MFAARKSTATIYLSCDNIVSAKCTPIMETVALPLKWKLSTRDLTDCSINK